jgi:hypothetical protein
MSVIHEVAGSGAVVKEVVKAGVPGAGLRGQLLDAGAHSVMELL